MGHEPDAHRQLADEKPQGGPGVAAPVQKPQRLGKKQRQDDILKDPHPRVGHPQRQQRAQPDEVAVPVAGVGKRGERGRIGTLRAGGQIFFEVPAQILLHGLEIVHVVGGVGHHGGERTGLIGGGRFKQHDGVGVIVHLEQLEAEKFRIQSLLPQRLHRAVDALPHRGAGQRVGAQQQQKQHRQRDKERQRRAPGKLFQVGLFHGRFRRFIQSCSIIRQNRDACNPCPRPPDGTLTAQCPSPPAASSDWCRRRRKTAG